MTYQEFLNEDAPCVNCFFAFSNDQFVSGKKEAGLSDDDKILSGGHGLYGTREGIKAFYDFYNERDARIVANCKPQEVYDFEFINHECDYMCDDSEAIDIVVDLFGLEASKVVSRKWAYRGL